MGVVYARGIRAAALAFAFANVNPAFLSRLSQKRLIAFAQRRKTFDDEFVRFVERHLDFRVLYEGNVDVIHVLFGKSRYFFTKGNILVHGRQVCVYRFNEGFVYLDIHVFAVHRHRHTAVVISHRFIENVFFHVAGVRLRDRVDKLHVRAVIFFKPFLTFFRV